MHDAASGGTSLLRCSVFLQVPLRLGPDSESCRSMFLSHLPINVHRATRFRRESTPQRQDRLPGSPSLHQPHLKSHPSSVLGCCCRCSWQVREWGRFLHSCLRLATTWTEARLEVKLMDSVWKSFLSWRMSKARTTHTTSSSSSCINTFENTTSSLWHHQLPPLPVRCISTKKPCVQFRSLLTSRRHHTSTLMTSIKKFED